MPASWRSPRTEVRPSPIHGRGLFARRPIRRGEIVAIKGGHVLDRATLRRVRAHIAASYIQIEDDHYLGAAAPAEVRRNKIWLNHSCQPNAGIRGQATFVAMRDVEAGEELTYDWAMEENSPARTRCRCGAAACREILTGQDWKRPELQRRYRGFFSAYLAAKIGRKEGGAPRRARPGAAAPARPGRGQAPASG